MGKIEDALKVVNEILGPGMVKDHSEEPGYDDDDYAGLVVKVDFENLKACQELIWASESVRLRTVNVSVKAITPTLVPAKLGDFVLHWNDWAHCEDDVPVGVVTSILTTPEGKTRYGCRHIIARNFHSMDTFRAFEITADNYGGHPEGFLRVLTKEEALKRAASKIRKDYEERMANLREELEDLDQSLGDATALFQNHVQVNEIRLEPLR